MAMRNYLSSYLHINSLQFGETPGAKLWRALANAVTLAVRARRTDIAYVSVPGQSGAWLLLPALAALRLRGISAWFHHHSYRAINLWPQRSMNAVVKTAGRRQCHVLLSPLMRDRFAAHYLGADPQRALALSNAFLFGPKGRPDVRPTRPPTLGHVSVLTREKGVFFLLDLFERLLARGLDLRLILAGPCSDAKLLRAIATAVARHPGRIEYRGMITGKSKDAFYRDIDLFVLPTTLIDEAEPLVMFEAYAAGVDVVATDTGCIADRIISRGRLLSLDSEIDAEMIDRLIAGHAEDWPRARAACLTHAQDISDVAARDGEVFIDKIVTENLS